MRISLAGKSSQAGFTLVEVLAVLFIMALMAGAVVMNLPSKPNPLHEQGQKLASRIGLTAQTSLVEQQTFGVNLYNDSYDIVKYFNGKWQLVESFDYEFDGRPIIALTQNTEKVDLEQARKSGIPPLRFDSTGLGTPFVLRIEDTTSSFIITGAIDGIIIVEPK